MFSLGKNLQSAWELIVISHDGRENCSLYDT